MCGIAGIVNYKDIHFENIIQSLKHRGPDDQTLYQDDTVALIHTRLAIQDVENGAQPFHHENFSIIFNGEIYNHHELRAKLTEFNFKTNSDTETLLYLFIKYQYKMFDLLDGMFAFCIYDKANQQIILARDRAGKKPLYYLQENNSFIFASELNAIKAVKKLDISTDAVNCYLRTGMIWKSYTVYQHVSELEAGSYLVLNLTHLTSRTYSYFNILDFYGKSSQNKMGFKDAIDTLENKIKISIRDRLMASDVEVGVFLSGGIDSNLIAAMASTVKPGLKTFTVKFAGLYDESHLAKLTAEKYKTNHIELSIASELNNDIEKIISAYGEPFMDSSAIPSYYVSREASQHVKVVLGGDGADELFAGYRRYVPVANQFMNYVKLISPLLRYLPKPSTKQSGYNYLHRLAAMSNKKNLDHYLSATSDIFEDAYTFTENKIISELNQFLLNLMAMKNLTPLKKMMCMDFNFILFSDLLVKMDIASMANSLEVRSPFLSKHLLEFAPNLPDQYKINGFKTKYILRKLAEKYLPTALINQPKRGFEVPLKKWVDFDLHDNIADALATGCYAENFVNRNFIQSLLTKKIPVPAEKRAKMLWSLYCLEVWHQNENRFFS